MMLVGIIIIIVMSLVKLDTLWVLGQCECGGPYSTLPFQDILTGIEYYTRCTYPTDKLNVECLLTSCPALRGVCPLTSSTTGCIDENALNSALSILNTCIGQTERLICGINMTHTPMIQISFTTTQLLPSDVINGTIHLNPGTAYIDNLSSAKFTLLRSETGNGPLQLSVEAPTVHSYGNYNCSFDIAQKSFLKSLLGTMKYVPSLNAPLVSGVYTFNMSYTVAIDLSTGATPTVHTINNRSIFNTKWSNFVNCDNKGLDQALVDIFNTRMTSMIKASVMLSTVLDFLSTYAAIGLQAAQLNCA